MDSVICYSSFFKDYNVFSIAISGTPNNHIIDQYFKPKGETKQKHIPTTRILNECDYKNIIIDNLIQEKVDDLSFVLDNLNKLMDKNKIETNKRTIILGSIIFSLTNFSQFKKDIEKLRSDSTNIVDVLVGLIRSKLTEVLPNNKWENNKYIIDRLCNSIQSYPINNEIWKEVVEYVIDKLIPIINKMKKETYHDFSGDMYRVLLRYTAGDGKALGQVLTPKHIANLMIDLVELRKGDSVIDPACGTGVFLINCMNKLITLADTKQEIQNIKSKQIYGIEISLEMFFLTLTNMLINGNSKTNIYVDDNNTNTTKRGIFRHTSNDFILKPQKLIMNPPYLTHKEMWTFIMKGLELASDKASIIIPTSILNNNSKWKAEFLKKHSLLSVVNMPNNIFQNKSSSGASVKTSILIIEINKPNKNNHIGTYFYNLKSDGFISSRKHGRYDGNNKWNQIKDTILHNYYNKSIIKNTSVLIKNIRSNDNWHFNYFNTINTGDFININEYLFNIIDTLIRKNESSTLKIEVIKANLLKNIKIKEISINKISLFEANSLLKIENNINKAFRIEKYDDVFGDMSYVSASNRKNGSRKLNIRNIHNESVLENKFTWNTQGDGGAGLSFYHPYKFIVAGTTLTLSPINNKMSLHRKIFLAYCMSLEKKNRYHGNSITKKEFKNGLLKVTLPTNNKNEIDWLTIDEFMKNNNLYKIIENLIFKRN